jgi:hypothetical protein
MAHAFKPISAKPTFGTVNNGRFISQSDYLNNKKGYLFYSQTSNCNLNCCNKLIKTNSYKNKYLFNLGQLTNQINKGIIVPFDKQNLVAGQYTYMDLSGVCCAIDGSICTDIFVNDCTQCDLPCPINVATSTQPFYFTNTIDPLGQLFGNSQCGELNYTHYMRYKKNV